MDKKYQYQELIRSTKEIYRVPMPDWHSHAGYNKYSSQKEMLHNSLLQLKEHLKTDDVFVVSTLFKLESYEDFSYYVYFPETNSLFKIFIEAEYDYISVNWTPIKEYMVEHYMNKMNNKFEIMKKDRKPEVVTYMEEFFKTYEESKPIKETI